MATIAIAISKSTYACYKCTYVYTVILSTIFPIYWLPSWTPTEKSVHDFLRYLQPTPFAALLFSLM